MTTAITTNSANCIILKNVERNDLVLGIVSRAPEPRLFLHLSAREISERNKDTEREREIRNARMLGLPAFGGIVIFHPSASEIRDIFKLSQSPSPKESLGCSAINRMKRDFRILVMSRGKCSSSSRNLIATSHFDGRLYRRVTISRLRRYSVILICYSGSLFHVSKLANYWLSSIMQRLNRRRARAISSFDHLASTLMHRNRINESLGGPPQRFGDSIFARAREARPCEIHVSRNSR